MKKAASTALKTAGKEAAMDASMLAKQTATDKAKQFGLGALSALSGGEDEPEDTYAAKFGNIGSTIGGLAGGLGAGTAGSIIPGAGTITGGLAGGTAGSWAGRFAGKALGSLVDKFTSGDKVQAIKELATLLSTGGLSGLMYALSDFYSTNPDQDSEDVESLFRATKKRVPDEYDDILDDAAEEAEDLD